MPHSMLVVGKRPSTNDTTKWKTERANRAPTKIFHCAKMVSKLLMTRSDLRDEQRFQFADKCSYACVAQGALGELACRSSENAKSLLRTSTFFETNAKIVALVNTAAAMTNFNTISQCDAAFI
jgi:hypothetical protein